MDPFENLVLDGKTGSYTLERLVGEGGMGLVYSARAVGSGKQFAVKVLRPKLRSENTLVARFRREAAVQGRFRENPGVVTVVDSGSSPETGPFIVLEWVAAPTLPDYVQSVGYRRHGAFCLQPLTAAAIALRLCPLLHTLHAAKVVHRDIKPENMFVEQDGNIKLSDFGLALPADQSAAQRQTQTGISVGTVFCMAPEQARDSKRVDLRVDIYSLGCVLYWLLVGHYPVGDERSEQNQNLARAQRGEVDGFSPSAENPSVPAALDQVVRKATCADPDRRYKSALEIGEAIRRCYPELSESAAAKLLMQARRRARAKRVLQIAGAGGALVSFSAGVLVIAYLFAFSVVSRMTETHEQFLARAQTLPAAEKVAAVVERLRKLNAQEVELNTNARTGTVIELEVRTAGLRDLSPICAFQSLESLEANGCFLGNAAIFGDMPRLRKLRVKNCGITDIGALKGKPLEVVDLSGNSISSIAALTGAPLKVLIIRDTKVVSLEPLTRSSVEILDCTGAPIAEETFAVLLTTKIREIYGDAELLLKANEQLFTDERSIAIYPRF